MKAEELRIGNWYNSVKFKTPVVCELTDLAELCHRSDGAYNDPPIDEMFEPIPLTEEWLLKFGFEYDGITWSKMSCPLMFAPHYTGYSVWYNTLTHGMIDIELKYVHQLQNLYYALTGEEL